VSAPRFARIGDSVRDGFGNDTIVIVGHHIDGGARGWAVRCLPADPADLPPFDCTYPYDFMERDVAKPGGLLAFSDPWSTWTEA